MPIAHTILREDFGALDRVLVKEELLRTAGVHGVRYDVTRSGLAIDYDPDVLPAPKLFELICRCGLYPDPHPPSQDDAEHGDS
jgi:hypothetical protein